MVKKHILFLGLLLFGVISIASAQTRISGKVTDAGNNQPIPLAGVIVKGTKLSVTTNINGEYTIDVPEGSKILLFSYEGYESKEEQIGTRTVINASLKDDVNILDEVVVTVYGTKSIASVSGNVASIRSKDIEKIPTASFDQALQGKAAGVMVSTTSGRPGATATIRVRGMSSINSGNDPLYIIDGITASSLEFSSLSNHDVESVNILKDASATALYGSRAANGVIIIVTKKGRKMDRAQISYSTYVAWEKKSKENFTLMNTKQKLEYEVFNGRLQESADAILARGIDTDWLDVLTGKTGFNHNHELSVRGGSDKIRYYTSVSYLDMEGILLSSEYKRYGFTANLEADATKHLKVGVTTNITQTNNDITMTRDLISTYQNNVYNPSFRGLLENPYVTVYREDGSYTTISDGLAWGNPVEHQLLNTDKQSTLRIMASAWAELALWGDKIKAKTLVGVQDLNRTSDAYTSPYSAWGQTLNGLITRSYIRATRITNTNTIVYNDTYADAHNLTFLLGQETTQYESDEFRARGSGLANSVVDVLGATSKYDGAPFGSRFKNTLASFFAGANYNYMEKYYVDLAYRLDGSSRFGANNRWGSFGSVGAMWDAKKENFLADVRAISSLKIRASYGTMGNNNIGDYAHLSIYSVSGTYNGKPAGLLSSPENKDLTWEVIKMYDLGFNLGLLDNKIRVDFGYYNKKTTDMLMSVPISSTTGFTSGMRNIGEMVNKGVELKVDFTPVETNGFRWDIGGVLGYNKNEVLSLYGDVTEIPYEGSNTILKVGEAYGTRFVNRFAGVNPANGRSLWYTKDGDVTEEIRSSDLVVESGKSWVPKLTGGFSTTLSYKGIELQADFTFMNDFWITNNAKFFTESNGAMASYNQTVNMLDHWKKPGDISRNPDPRLQQQYFDDRYIEDASFLRLRSLSLAYTFPEKLLEKTKFLKSARIYVQGFNLFTWTKYEGYDPEQYAPYEMGSYPQVQKFVFGLQIGF